MPQGNKVYAIINHLSNNNNAAQVTADVTVLSPTNEVLASGQEMATADINYGDSPNAIQRALTDYITQVLLPARNLDTDADVCFL